MTTMGFSARSSNGVKDCKTKRMLSALLVMDWMKWDVSTVNGVSLTPVFSGP